MCGVYRKLPLYLQLCHSIYRGYSQFYIKLTGPSDDKFSHSPGHRIEPVDDNRRFELRDRFKRRPSRPEKFDDSTVLTLSVDERISCGPKQTISHEFKKMFVKKILYTTFAFLGTFSMSSSMTNCTAVFFFAHGLY